MYFIYIQIYNMVNVIQMCVVGLYIKQITIVNMEIDQKDAWSRIVK